MSAKLLEVVNIEKKYGDFSALQGVTIAFEQGKIISLLGVNGAGKTTLSSIIATLKPPTSGDIFFKGSSIYLNLNEYRKNIGFCPQRPNLHNMITVRENLDSSGRYMRMSKDDIEKRIKELSSDLEIAEYLDKNPRTLSGGYKQRVLIARSIMHNPKILILDEPTVGLDPQIRRNLWEILKKMRDDGMTIIFTTHYLEEAEVLSDYVCVLDHGDVSIFDTPENLKKKFEKKNLEDVFIQLVKETNEK